MITRLRRRAWARASRFVIGFVAGLAAMAVVSAASAQTRASPIEPAPEPLHRTQLKIPAGGPYPITRRITMGVDKSMLIELPVDLTNVLVSNPEVIDAVVQTSRQVYLLAKDMGEANAFFIGQDGQKVLFLEVTVARDLTALNDTLQRLLPGSKIRAEMVGDNVVLSGSVVDPVDANRAAELAGRFVKKKDSVVNMLATNAKEQVLLKVQVAEMQRDAIRRLGVDLPGALLQSGHLTVTQVLRNQFPVTSSIAAAAVAQPTGELPIVAAGSGRQITWERGAQSVTGLVQALERAGLLRTLAEPSLTAISGETAKFLAGGEFPIPISQQNNTITVEYKQFGVNVTFKPIVQSEGRISLAISAEVSEITPEGSVSIGSISLPGLKVRRAETTLELPSGGTLAMAGLLSDDTRQSVEGLPGLKNLPVLGALFRSNDYRRRESELVILVTPYLATHARKKEFTRPDEGFMPQSELKELFFGHINRVYGRPTHPPASRYHGDYGFIIDYPPGVKG